MNKLKNRNKFEQVGMSLIVSFGLLAVSTSYAATETEVNGSFATANAVDPGANSGVIGDLSAVSNDVDIWKFDLTAGAGMGVSISDGVGTNYNDFDPVIVLFMEDGGNYYPVAGNNPIAFSTSFGFTPWESGTYFLTVSTFGNSPQDAFGNNQYDSIFWTDNFFGFGTPFDGFQGAGFSSFDYNLSLNGAVSTVVPVPAAVWLFGSGLFGLLGLARRKAQ